MFHHFIINISPANRRSVTGLDTVVSLLHRYRHYVKQGAVSRTCRKSKKRIMNSKGSFHTQGEYSTGRRCAAIMGVRHTGPRTRTCRQDVSLVGFGGPRGLGGLVVNLTDGKP